jgi:methylated-DNA-[protein]-cysteine S-methyltransferase
MTTLSLSSFNSPLGLLHIAHVDDCLYALTFEEFYPDFIQQLENRFADIALVESPMTAVITQALSRYFAGELHALDELRVNVTDTGTAFQQQVWQGLRTIGAGQTYSYQQLAQKIGCVNGQRAVGSANGRNPIPLVIPCHRVINSNGKLGGFSGALWRKEWLLQHEGVVWQK